LLSVHDEIGNTPIVPHKPSAEAIQAARFIDPPSLSWKAIPCPRSRRALARVTTVLLIHPQGSAHTLPTWRGIPPPNLTIQCIGQQVDYDLAMLLEVAQPRRR
jgi:hypothetical protein